MNLLLTDGCLDLKARARLQPGRAYAPSTEGLSDNDLSGLWSQVLNQRKKDLARKQRKLSKTKSYDMYFAYHDRDVFTKEFSLLNKGNYTIPGQGESPDYCHTPFYSHIHESGNSIIEMIVTCKLARCPCCYRTWIDNNVFQYATKLELYSRHTGDRPFRAVASANTQTKFTLDSLRKFRRNAKNRMKKQGITAGFSLDHPFRIHTEVKDAIRALRPAVGSGGMWDFLLDPGNIPLINEHIGSQKYCTWRDCVELSFHTHYLLFPGSQKITGDKDIFIKKVITEHQDGTKTITLDTTADIVKHIKYLFTHSEILQNAAKYRSEPAGVFGDLWKWDYTQHFTTEEINSVQAEILEILNKGRDKQYIIGPEGLTFSQELKERDPFEGYIPIHKLMAYGPFSRDCQDAFISSISNLDNREYCEYLINQYEKLKDLPIPTKLKRLFTDRVLYDDPKTGKPHKLRSPPSTMAVVRLNV